MPVGAATSTHNAIWIARDKDVKTYLHFDRRLTKSELENIANDRDAVSTNRFYPLLRFSEEWTKFRQFGKAQKKKVRPLRYASRRDAAIFARYRTLLSKLYEEELVRRGIGDAPIAYRRISANSGEGNKCNIEFARDIFDKINLIGECNVTVVDISSYFENIDHSLIRKYWQILLGAELPPDHEAVFKAITQYSVVDVESVFERLGLHEKGVGASRAERRMRKIDRILSDGGRQICSPQEFRDMVCGGHPSYPSLIQRNTKPYGIPQGTPISDLVANFYLLDFDERVSQYCFSRGGYYRRYSDDIICVVPSKNLLSETEVKEFLQSEISNHGPMLKIQDRKVSICEFYLGGGTLSFRHIFADRARNGLEYLGFEYNGESVKIKNSTLSNAWRKLRKHAYGFARRFVRKYRSRGDIWITANFPYDFLQKKLLKDVSYSQDLGYEEWTFIKYVRRAARGFIGYNRVFSKQTRRYRYRTATVIEACLLKAIAIHGKAAVLARGGRP